MKHEQLGNTFLLIPQIFLGIAIANSLLAGAPSMLRIECICFDIKIIIISIENVMIHLWLWPARSFVKVKKLYHVSYDDFLKSIFFTFDYFYWTKKWSRMLSYTTHTLLKLFIISNTQWIFLSFLFLFEVFSFSILSLQN